MQSDNVMLVRKRKRIEVGPVEPVDPSYPPLRFWYPSIRTKTTLLPRVGFTLLTIALVLMIYASHGF